MMTTSQARSRFLRMPSGTGWLYLLLTVSVVFALRALTVTSTILLIASGLFHQRTESSQQRAARPFVVLCALMFVLAVVALINTSDAASGWRYAKKASGLVALPLSIWLTAGTLQQKHANRLVLWLTVSLLVAMAYCLSVAMFRYADSQDPAVFFYHDLVRPMGQHAIQLSIYVFFALQCLTAHPIDDSYLTRNKKWIIAILLVFLLLLGSKLVIGFYLFLNIWRRVRSTRGLRSKIPIILTLVGLSAFMMMTPVGKRFLQLGQGDPYLFLRKDYDQGIYFNGIQFRLLQWRLTGEILAGNRAWLAGVSPGDAQEKLNAKYRELNMYRGVQGTDDHGLTGFHTHNFFLQAALDYGLTGLLLTILIFAALFSLAKRSGDSVLKSLAWLLFLYAFCDAAFETQFGIVLMTFLPLLRFFHTAKQSVSLAATYHSEERF